MKAALAGTGGFILAIVASHFRSTPYDNYVLLAQAFLHGRVWIDWPGPFIDALTYNGHRYVIEAPVPAVLLIPYVALAGTSANQTLACAVLAGIAVGAAWRLAERLGANVDTAAWLVAFALAGTPLLWCAMLGDVWFMAHVSAVAFTMLALVELSGRRRGWLVALWAIFAAGSRFSMVLAMPVYFAWLVVGASRLSFARINRRDAVTAIGGFIAVLVAGAILWGAYNEARWGTLADIGYTTWYHADAAGMKTGSPFRLLYLPYEARSFFVQAPAFAGVFPWIRPDISGVALTWTSPALIVAFFARRPVALVALLWVAAVLVATPSLLYYVNGFAQYGMRHVLDFMPFLFALMVLASRERLALWAKVLLAYSCVASFYGVWYWNAFVRPGN